MSILTVEDFQEHAWFTKLDEWCFYYRRSNDEASGEELDYLALWIGPLAHCPDAEAVLLDPVRSLSQSSHRRHAPADFLYDEFEQMTLNLGHHITIGYLPSGYVQGSHLKMFL